jgi:UDP-hydrolysing UDP-N-acetyl-D-glucosamine 2-epimerase
VREPRRVAVATFGRSDFSILRPLCRLLAADERFETGLWVAGAHFDEVSGRTIDDVEASGIPVWAHIDPGPYDRSPLGTVEVMASQLRGFASAAEARSSPSVDLLLILGDRFEAVAAGLAMVPLGIPVGHISGGSITEGAIDDVFRHCLTKIASVHFCDLPRFAQRLQLMGEPRDRIFTTGALGLDALHHTGLRTFEGFVQEFGLDALRPGYLLATLHPESRHLEHTGPMASAMVAALIGTGRQVVLTYPNADPGSDVVVDVVESAAAHDDVYCVRGFGADWFPTAMANAALMVGNSSGGIIEAASFGLPVVDIGDRQKGRERGPNVVHCARDRSSIGAAIDAALDPDFTDRAGAPNIYGDGRGCERVIAALAALDWSSLNAPKRFADPDPTFAGELMELSCD